MPKAAPALTSQWQDLTVLPTPPHLLQLKHTWIQTVELIQLSSWGKDGPVSSQLVTSGLGNY